MKQSCQSRNWFVYANKPTWRLTSHANDFGNAKIKAMHPRKKASRARHGLRRN